MFDLAQYWEKRYADGRDSGEGSRGEIAKVKGGVVNRVINQFSVQSLLDWGCGDGQVLDHITDQVWYTGIDLSPTVLDNTSQRHSERSFLLDTGTPTGVNPLRWLRADMSLSMDVMFHLVHAPDYWRYLANLFNSSQKVVLVWATDSDEGLTARHVRRRQWTPDVERLYPEWELVERAAEVDTAGPYVYRKMGS